VGRIDATLIDGSVFVTSALYRIATIGRGEVLEIGAYEQADIEWDDLPEMLFDGAYFQDAQGIHLVFSGWSNLLDVDLSGRTIQEHALAWVPTTGLPCDGAGLTRALAMDDSGRLHGANAEGIWAVDVHDWDATQEVIICNAENHHLAVTPDGSLAYVTQEDVVVRVALATGETSEFAATCVDDSAPCGRELSDVAVDPRTGDVYVASMQSCLFRYSPDGMGSVFAGDCTELGNSGDGGDPLDARFTVITSIAFDSLGNLFIADNGAGVVRVVVADLHALVWH